MWRGPRIVDSVMFVLAMVVLLVAGLCSHMQGQESEPRAPLHPEVIRAEGVVRMNNVPEEWRKKWLEVGACLTDEGIRTLPVAFDDYEFFAYDTITVTSRRKGKEEDHVYGWHFGPDTPQQIFIRRDHMDSTTVEHEFVHAWCGDECKHCEDEFEACAGGVQPWCEVNEEQ